MILYYELTRNESNKLKANKNHCYNWKWCIELWKSDRVSRLGVRFENCDMSSPLVADMWCGGATNKTGCRLSDFLEPAMLTASVKYALFTSPGTNYTNFISNNNLLLYRDYQRKKNHHRNLPLNIEFWYIGSGCKRTCRVAKMNANVASIHASIQPDIVKKKRRNKTLENSNFREYNFVILYQL